jgi:ATP-dependent helicase/nuclease subunit A
VTGAGRRPRRPPPGGPRDQESRTAAVTDFGRNLVVTAGAGTGKTALLVERALNLVAGGGVALSSVAAITFTEKAAAELRDRLARGFEDLHRLAAAAADPETVDLGAEAGRSYRWLRAAAGEPAARIAARSLAALHDLDVAAVGTIHAFCAELLRRQPVEAGVDAAFDIDEGGSFRALLETETSRYLAEELGPAAPRAALWDRVLGVTGGLGAVRDVGAAFGGFRLPTAAVDPARPYAPPAARDVLGGDLAALLDDLGRLLRRAAGANPNMIAHLEAARGFLAAVLQRGPGALAAPGEAERLQELLRQDPAPGKRLTGVDPEALAAGAARARDLLRALARVDEAAVGAVVDAAVPLGVRARRALLHAGLVTFDGLLRLTRDLLADRPAVRRALGRRHAAILLDEFQDTDPLQYEILFFLCEAEGPAAAGAYRTRLAPGRLFIVGDPKQSIYRFRGADIEAYQRAVDHVLRCGGREVTLSSSFRSPPGIVEPINRLFAPWMVPEAGGGARFQAPYVPIDAARAPAGGDGPRVEIWSVAAAGDGVARRRAEAEAIAAWIAARRGGRDATGAPLEYRHVAILLRALTHAGLYAQALRQGGIPFLVEGGKEFYERHEVGDLIAFLRAVANPNDGPAALAVMRSILGAVPDPELADFAAAGGRLDVAGGGLAGLAPWPGVARVFGMIETFRSRARGRAVDAVVRDAVRDTPLAILHAAAFDGAQRIANLRRLVAEAEELARRGLSLEELIGVLEDENRTERDGGESPLADETIDVVRVLSVHKAKGLEYPVVFVPDIGRQPGGRRGPASEVAWVPAPGDGGVPAVRLEGGATNLAWVKHADSARRHDEAEEKRVFYVACTRARERLILVNSNPRNGRAPWRAALAALGYRFEGGFPEDGLLSPGVAHRVVAPTAAAAERRVAGVDPAWERAARAFLEASAAAAAGAAPPLRWPSGARDAALAGAGDREGGIPAGPAAPPDAPPPGPGPAASGRARPDAARLAGTAVHAALERWDFRDAAALRAATRRQAERAARDAAADLPRRPARDLAAAVGAESAAVIEAFLATALPDRLAAAEILGREVPILYRDDGGTTWIGACDLLYRDRDGAVVVADYKTDRVGGDPAAAAAAYGDQLRVYREAVARALEGRPVRAEILFVRTGDVMAV